MIVAYTFVFSGVFGARWRSGVEESPLEFGIALFCGLIVFNVFSEVVGQASTIVRSHTNYVKRIAFPLQVLPVVGLNASLLHAGLSALVLAQRLSGPFEGVGDRADRDFLVERLSLIVAFEQAEYGLAQGFVRAAFFVEVGAAFCL